LEEPSRWQPFPSLQSTRTEFTALALEFHIGINGERFRNDAFLFKSQELSYFACPSLSSPSPSILFGIKKTKLKEKVEKGIGSK
jgi:hypothetical protein